MAYPYADQNNAHADGVSEVIAAEDINDLATALNDLKTELGSGPKGGAADLTARLANDATLIVAISDETTAITPAANDVLTFRMPFAMTLTEVRGSLVSACTTGTFTIDIHNSGTTIMTTNKITIDATEKTSETAATGPTLTDTALADDAIISIDIDNEGDGTATGAKVTLIGTRAT